MTLVWEPLPLLASTYIHADLMRLWSPFFLVHCIRVGKTVRRVFNSSAIPVAVTNLFFINFIFYDDTCVEATVPRRLDWLSSSSEFRSSVFRVCFCLFVGVSLGFWRRAWNMKYWRFLFTRTVPTYIPWTRVRSRAVYYVCPHHNVFPAHFLVTLRSALSWELFIFGI